MVVQFLSPIEICLCWCACAHSTLSNAKLSDELPPLSQVSLDLPAYYLEAGLTYTGDLTTATAIMGRSVRVREC